MSTTATHSQQLSQQASQSAAAVLTKAQAEAVYSAMCSLNKVCARLQAFDLDADGLVVMQRANGSIAIGYLITNPERGTILQSHADQAAFAAAYGL